jgi:hypothetical protein
MIIHGNTDFSSLPGNWQDAVADVPAALDSFTVAETTVEAAT